MQWALGGLECIAVDKLEILEQIDGLQMPLGDCNQLSHVALSRTKPIRCGEQSAADGKGTLRRRLLQQNPKKGGRSYWHHACTRGDHLAPADDNVSLLQVLNRLFGDLQLL